MTGDEYKEMVNYIEDLWGVNNAWVGAARLYDQFAGLDTDQVYECLLARRDGDPEKARFAPKPAELRALTLERMRRVTPPELPETTEKYTWAEHSQKTYGEVIPIGEAIRRRHEELREAGKIHYPRPDEEATMETIDTGEAL